MEHLDLLFCFPQPSGQSDLCFLQAPGMRQMSTGCSWANKAVESQPEIKLPPLLPVSKFELGQETDWLRSPPERCFHCTFVMAYALDAIGEVIREPIFRFVLSLQKFGGSQTASLLIHAHQLPAEIPKLLKTWMLCLIFVLLSLCYRPSGQHRRTSYRKMNRPLMRY